jgi:hypothetical protein
MSTKSYSAVVAATVGAHFAYLAYVPSGGFLALRWPRTIWLHLATVCWGFGVVALDWSCPLTSLESWARVRAGMGPLPETGFIDRYVAGVLYPARHTGTVQALAFVTAAASWIGAAATHKSRSVATCSASGGRIPETSRLGPRSDPEETGRFPTFRRVRP